MHEQKRYQRREYIDSAGRRSASNRAVSLLQPETAPPHTPVSGLGLRVSASTYPCRIARDTEREGGRGDGREGRSARATLSLSLSLSLSLGPLGSPHADGETRVWGLGFRVSGLANCSHALKDRIAPSRHVDTSKDRLARGIYGM